MYNLTIYMEYQYWYEKIDVGGKWFRSVNFVCRCGAMPSV